MILTSGFRRGQPVWNQDRWGPSPVCWQQGSLEHRPTTGSQACYRVSAFGTAWTGGRRTHPPWRAWAHRFLLVPRSSARLACWSRHSSGPTRTGMFSLSRPDTQCLVWVSLATQAAFVGSFKPSRRTLYRRSTDGPERPSLTSTTGTQPLLETFPRSSLRTIAWKSLMSNIGARYSAAANVEALFHWALSWGVAWAIG